MKIGAKVNIKVVNILIISLILLICVYAVIYFFLMPTIRLKGSNKIIINYQDDYKESGYKATYYGKDMTKKIKISGKVNTKKLGTYKIEYTIKNGIFKKKIVRTIKVRDKEKPVISFENNNKIIYLCPNQDYNIKYKAYDNYDKDITDKVKVTKKKDMVKYAVTDSSGNYTIKEKKIITDDREIPELSLVSGDVIFTYLGENFDDPGYKVYDNCDRNLEKSVNVEGTVNTKEIGSYILTYKVTDLSGNIAKKTRKVNVVKKIEPGTIYLTFDDGPRMGTTNIILDILKEENVKATFFVTNRGPDELIKREYEEGHSVGLHTASHDYSLVYSSVEDYFNDLYSVHDRVYNLTGYDSKIIRFPGGSSNTVSKKYMVGIMSQLTKEVLNRNFKYYDWNINSRDTDGLTNSVEIAKQVITHLSHDKVNVILMHDIKSYTRDALKSIIEYGKTNGYNFSAITNETAMITQQVNN